jgi:hypothetical protein
VRAQTHTRERVLLSECVHVLRELLQSLAGGTFTLGNNLDKVDKLLASSLLLRLELLDTCIRQSVQMNVR